MQNGLLTPLTFTKISSMLIMNNIFCRSNLNEDVFEELQKVRDNFFFLFFFL